MTFFAKFACVFRPRVRLLPRRLAITTLFPLLTYGTLCAFAQKVMPTPAEAKSFRLGAFEISVLRDGRLVVPNDGSIFGLNADPSAVAEILREAGAPTDEIRLDIDTLLIRMRGHLVLVDAGYGPVGHGIVRESLALVGVPPDEITDILITHAHPDHVGGLVDAQGRSAFPKAAIRMSAEEWAYMQSNVNTRAEASVIKAQVQIFEPGRPLLPGITPLALPGHTPGQVGYEIMSQGHGLFDTGDMAHSSIISLAKPGWTIKWDFDKQEGVRTRRQELRQLATTHELIFAPHFPFPGVGRIERAGESFRFRPELPSGK